MPWLSWFRVSEERGKRCSFYSTPWIIQISVLNDKLFKKQPRGIINSIYSTDIVNYYYFFSNPKVVWALDT